MNSELQKRARKSKLKRPSERMLEDLQKSGLTAADAKQLNFEPYTEEGSAALGLPRTGDGYRISYFSAEGQLLPVFRYRYFDTAPTRGFLKGAKLSKYCQPPNTPTEIYLSRIGGMDWPAIMKDVSQWLLITEGEKKSACACKHGFPTIGLGGVFSFGCKDKGQELLPSLEAFNWKGRDAFIVFDSDAAEKAQVMQAENRLASLLVARGARVYVVRLPEGEDKKKAGLDDHIVKHGADVLEKQLELTAEWALSRRVHEMCAEYVYVENPSIVVRECDGAMFPPRTFVSETTANDIITITDGKKSHKITAGKALMESPLRPTVKCLTYKPGQPRITDVPELNWWRGFGCEPCPGDTRLWEKLLVHLFPDATEREYLENWCAAPIQNPGFRTDVAAVVWGEKQGTGKTLLGTTIGMIHGRENYTEITQTELHSPFNDWQANKTFIQGSEVCGERDSRAVADKLKTFITGETVQVNKKYIPAYVLPNPTNFYFTSNHDNAVYIGEHARRFAVFHVKNGPLPPEFYADFVCWRDAGGLSAIYHRLLTKDLSKFNCKGHAPKTEAREEMIEASRTQVQSWCHELRTNTDTALALAGSQQTVPGAVFTTEELLRIFNGGEQTRLTAKGMASALRAEGFTLANNGGLIRIPGTVLRLRLWIIRDAQRVESMSAGEIGALYAKQIRVRYVRSAAAGGRG